MNYQTYRTLFINWAFQPNSGVLAFSMSDDERVLQYQPGISYPLVELDSPSYDVNAECGTKHTKTYRGAVSITESVGKSDFQAQDDVLDKLEPVMDSLIAYLKAKEDILKPWLRKITIEEIYPVKRFETDNKWGWGMSFSMQVGSNFHIKDLKEYHTLYLDPGFQEGKTSLNILLEGEPFSAALTSEKETTRALDALVEAINGDEIPINAYRYLGVLILVHEEIDTEIQYNFSPDSHPWSGFDIDGPIESPDTPVTTGMIHDQYHDNYHE